MSVPSIVLAMLNIEPFASIFPFMSPKKQRERREKEKYCKCKVSYGNFAESIRCMRCRKLKK